MKTKWSSSHYSKTTTGMKLKLSIFRHNSRVSGIGRRLWDSWVSLLCFPARKERANSSKRSTKTIHPPCVQNWLDEEFTSTSKYWRSLHQCITTQLHVLHKLMTYIMTQDGKLHTKKNVKISKKHFVACFSLRSPRRCTFCPRTDAMCFSWALRLLTMRTK